MGICISKKNKYILFESRIYSKEEVYCTDNECPICLLCPSENNDEFILTSCRHMFHKKCLQEWSNVRKVCPTCNTKL